MSQKKTLRQRMQDGEVLTALRGWLTTTKEELADIWSTGEFDYIWIDSQHTPFSEEQLVALLSGGRRVGYRRAIAYPAHPTCLYGRALSRLGSIVRS